MPVPRDWKVHFAFWNQVTVTAVTFILAIVLLAQKADIEAHEMRFGVKGVAVAPYWIPLLAFGFFLQAGFSAASCVGVWKTAGWAIVPYGIALGLASLTFAMTILLTTFLGWVASFVTVFIAVVVPFIFVTPVHKQFR